MIAMIGTTKAKKTATTSCLGVLMGPSCGPCSAWGGVASLMESSRLREDRCVPDVLWATQNPSIIKGGLWPKADNRCRHRARCDNPRHAPVAQWIEYCPPKAGVAGSIPAGRATPHTGGVRDSVTTTPAPATASATVTHTTVHLRLAWLRNRLRRAGQKKSCLRMPFRPGWSLGQRRERRGQPHWFEAARRDAARDLALDFRRMGAVGLDHAGIGRNARPEAGDQPIAGHEGFHALAVHRHVEANARCLWIEMRPRVHSRLPRKKARRHRGPAYGRGVSGAKLSRASPCWAST